MVGECSGTFLQKHKVQPSSYTAVQVTDISFDYWQKKLHMIFSKFTYVNYLENPSNKSPDTNKLRVFFSQSVLHYWPIAAKCTSAVPNDSAARVVQLQENS